MNQTFRKTRHSINHYVDGLLNGNRMMLSKSITLIESKLADDNATAEAIIEKILPHTGQSVRIGISGIPGAGKSTFIECFGNYLITEGKKVAVLTINPSSKKTRGSILGDKTRMEQLSNNENAYVRTSPSGSTLGGVHANTRESILLCEAAGYDVIIVETIGVGQNEINVRSMVDIFILLLIAGAGDELQGIKRGVVEVSDVIVINKADGDNMVNASLAKTQYQNALHFLASNKNGWQPVVTTCSSLNSYGVNEIWDIIMKYEKQMRSNGFFEKQRNEQKIAWMHDMISKSILDIFYKNILIQEKLCLMEQQVTNATITASQAAREVIETFSSIKKV